MFVNTPTENKLTAAAKVERTRLPLRVRDENQAIRAILQGTATHTAARPSPLSSIDVWTLGRAMERVKPSETPFYKRDAPYLIGIEANWQNRADADANIAWARSVFEDMKPFTRGGDYLNFPGFFEDRERLLRGAYGPNLERLRVIKARYDPTHLFLGALRIAPAA